MIAPSMLERIKACAHCGREMAVSALSYAENPFCSICLDDRLAAASPTGHLEWVITGAYATPVRRGATASSSGEVTIGLADGSERVVRMPGPVRITLAADGGVSVDPLMTPLAETSSTRADTRRSSHAQKVTDLLLAAVNGETEEAQRQASERRPGPRKPRPCKFPALGVDRLHGGQPGRPAIREYKATRSRSASRKPRP